jgi:CBS domain containing-hemolysin-like protein
MTNIAHAVGAALWMAFAMFWEILWPLILGFAISAAVLVSRTMVERAREQANNGVAGRMEGHGEMHMEVTEGGLWQRVLSEKGKTVISHYFVMDWVSAWMDIAGGLLIAGALAAWVPQC